jgi:DNA-binding XRE family transcriptional regulator
MANKKSPLHGLVESVVDATVTSMIERQGHLGLAMERLDRKAKASPELKAVMEGPRGDLPFWAKSSYLKKLREEVGLSQHNLARTIGISRSVIANYETGVTIPTLDSAIKICMVLKSLGNEEAAKTLILLATYDKEMCLAVRELLDGEIELLKERQEKMNKRIASLELLMNKTERK